jgi:lipoprotein-anchoring transpeptidase ErfK/SrfK
MRYLRSSHVAALLGASLTAAFLLAVASCHGEPKDVADTGVDAQLAVAIVDAGPPDTRAETVAAARAAFAAGTYEGPRIGAMNFATSVLDTMVWPDSDAGAPPGTRIGYLRHGAKIPVIPDPIVDSECPDGWYELVQGGFVCGKYATLDLKHPRVRLAPGPPNTDAGLPYRYGYNLTDGTPLYRRVLSLEDRKKYEPWLAPPPPVPEDAGAVDPAAEGATTPVAEEPTKEPAPPIDPHKPKTALHELRGRGVLVRKMVRGFYLALDKEFRAAHTKWWRTTGGFAVPHDRIVLQPLLTDFHGLWVQGPETAAISVDAGVFLDGGERRPGSGIVVFAKSESGAQRFTIDVEKKKVGWLPALPRRASVELTGETFTNGGVTYNEATGGFWVRLAEMTVPLAATPPADLAPNEKWIDVDLTRQMLVAYEGTKPVFATLVSSGRRNLQDRDHDYPTPPGTYRIREKHVTATMDGDVAADVPYSIEDVPWVMYFQGSYALHGAFWHAQFGHQRSHGCVNLSPEDARTLFAWSEPRLPVGWHGVYATAENPGTRVIVHEDTPAK